VEFLCVEDSTSELCTLGHLTLGYLLGGLGCLIR